MWLNFTSHLSVPPIPCWEASNTWPAWESEMEAGAPRLEAGADVEVLCEAVAEAACVRAGLKWNPPRKKRVGTRGVIESIDADAGAAVIKFETPAIDPETGMVIRVDAHSIKFAIGALKQVDLAAVLAAEAAAKAQQKAPAGSSSLIERPAGEPLGFTLNRDLSVATVDTRAEPPLALKGGEVLMEVNGNSVVGFAYEGALAVIAKGRKGDGIGAPLRLRFAPVPQKTQRSEPSVSLSDLVQREGSPLVPAPLASSSSLSPSNPDSPTVEVIFRTAGPLGIHFAGMRLCTRQQIPPVSPYKR